MDTTLLLTKVVGPVLLVRGISLIVDRKHFVTLLDRLEGEAKTITFQLLPVALLMAAITVIVACRDLTSPAGILIHLAAWGMAAKSTLLMLFPEGVLAKARLLGRAGFLNGVLFMCLAVGGYFSWFGYLRP